MYVLEQIAVHRNFTAKTAAEEGQNQQEADHAAIAQMNDGHALGGFDAMGGRIVPAKLIRAAAVQARSRLAPVVIVQGLRTRGRGELGLMLRGDGRFRGPVDVQG